MRRITLCAILPILCPALFLTIPAAGDDAKPWEPYVAPASKEAVQAMTRFRVPSGMKVELFAAEPLLANPVAFCFDEKGRCYVAETYRIQKGVTDNRGHMYWLDDDLASRTVADRVAMYKKFLKDKFHTYEIASDRVKLIEDTDGDGVADKASVFADGFNTAASGIGAGVLARKGNVYYTCIPDVWLLRDTKGTGKADVRKSLSTGYGVHVAFYGHDMHGLRMGPDGRLYFSIGDRGLNVMTPEGKKLFYPDTGCVLRCEPDGSHLEVFATGLRNPQELAFDQYGNLFTGDNNSDSGDKARLVYVVEGGDSGWRMGYQYGSEMSNRGPWNAEKLWHLQHDGQPAYIIPPVAHIADGPSGFCYNPGGAALPDRYAEHFFLCDFRGTPNRSGVRSFAVKPKGAGFEMVDQHEFIWSILATDCDFGPDGGFYISDWVHGWEGTGKGRIYRFVEPEKRKSAVVLDAKKLLADGFEKRSIEDLAKLLEHPDMRVRQEAQFALAASGDLGIPHLLNVTGKSTNRLARLHAIWGMGQILRRREWYCGVGILKGLKDTYARLHELRKDTDSEVRAQAIKMLGDYGGAGALDCVPLLQDTDQRVRMQAARALAHCNRPQTDKECHSIIQAILDLLRDNADKDPYLRHAGVIALARIASPADLFEQARRDLPPSVRMGILLAMRQQGTKSIARFLRDSEPRLVLEAARAIHDVPIPDALPELASLTVSRPNLPSVALHRALNAHFRLGLANNAAAVAAFAAKSDAPDKLRLEAVKMLGEWAKPGRRDRVTGLTQNLGERDPRFAQDAFRHHLEGIYSGSDKLREQATRVAGLLLIKEIGPMLFQMLAEKKSSPAARVEAVRALDALQDGQLHEAMRLALKDDDGRVRAEGRRVLARLQPAEAIPSLRQALEKEGTLERQSALAVLGEMKDAAADGVLAEWLDKLLAGKVLAEIQLDLLEAAARRDSPAVKEKLAKFEASRSKSDHLANYREALAGGNAEAGRAIFLDKIEVACQRCHKFQGEGGEVGPDLTGIGSKQNREYLLESIVDPSKQIAKGFETVVLALKDGTSVSGVFKEENGTSIKLVTPEGQFIHVAKKDIEARESGKSAMPEDIIKHLSKRELRDLVEFMAGLR
jgi:quinoprotein glucose dehydrogenase